MPDFWAAWNMSSKNGTEQAGHQKTLLVLGGYVGGRGGVCLTSIQCEEAPATMPVKSNKNPPRIIWLVLDFPP